MIWVQWLASTWMLALIWVIQCVHYPFFQFVSPNQQVGAARFHQARMGVLAGVPMVIELITFGVLTPSYWHHWAWWVSAIGLVIIWYSTWCIQVPIHRLLARSSNADATVRLVRSNWCRTIAWTIKWMAITWLVWP